MEKIEFTNKVDIWALGCSLYFMIHKKDPFDGKDPVEIKRKILNFKLLQMNANNSNASTSSWTEDEQEMQNTLMPLL